MKTRNKDIILSAEALRNPINTGITVSGFLVPIMVGIMTFSFTSNNYIVNKDFYIFSSIILIILSILFGLWNNYSLATLTNDEGKFNITKDDNTFFPALFVFQLSLLFFGITLLGLFGYNNMDKQTPKRTTKTNCNSNETVLIKKKHIPINTHKDLLLELWGKPSEISGVDSLQEFLYKSNESIFTYKIVNDTVTSINQKIKK